MIDLHTHSHYSDGSDSPEALVDLAADAGCSVIALTDHDTVRGVGEGAQRAHERGIEFIAGVELSCQVLDRNVHLLGYFLESGGDLLEQRLTEQRSERTRRNARLLERLNELGLDVSMDRVVALAGDESIGRPHFAAALVEIGAVSSIEDAFLRYLRDGAPGHVERHSLDAATGIAWIKQAGGISSWAHPLTPLEYRDGDLQPHLEILIEAGLDGLESHYSRYDKQQRDRLVRLAQNNGLIATGGSDYHGTYKPDLSVGVGEGNLRVPHEIFTEMRNRVASIRQ